jgi:peptidoglycan/LPS O-acetylase OafA/YrhL
MNAVPLPPTNRLDAIDALRGWAFLGVLLVHSANGLAPGPLHTLALHGSYVVALFFIASAFTLCRSASLRRQSETRPVASFFLRRFFRIVPLFWAGILLYYFVYGTWNRGQAEGPLTSWHFGLTALLLHGWHPDTINTVVPGGWSIAVEWTFYLILPLVLPMLSNLKRAWVGFIFSACLSMVICSFARQSGIRQWFPEVPEWRQQSFTYLWFPAHLATFALGVVVFHALPWFKSRVRHEVNLSKRGGAVLMLVILGMIGLAMTPDHLLKGIEFPLLLAAFCLCLLLYPTPFLVNQFTQQVGRLSFSAYITHFAVLAALRKGFLTTGEVLTVSGFVGLFAGALLMTMAASIITHRVIEIPGQSVGRWLLAKLNAMPLA